MSIKNPIDVEKLRQKYMENPPEGYSKREIKRIRYKDLLVMNYFSFF